MTDFIGTVFLYSLVILPATYFICRSIQKYWRFRKEQKLKTPEQKRQAHMELTFQQARSLGAILILGSFGMFYAKGAPGYARLVLFVFGAGLICAAYYGERKRVKK